MAWPMVIVMKYHLAAAENWVYVGETLGKPWDPLNEPMEIMKEIHLLSYKYDQKLSLSILATQ